MPRKRYKSSSVQPYHLTGRCINKEWFRLPLERVWSIFADQLYFANHAFDLKIHSFVLMTNHYHLIASTPLANLKEIMNYFMRETSRRISKESGRINQVFGGPYHWSLIDSHHYFLHAYKYVYRNPVEARLCSLAEKYPYSTLSGLLGENQLIIPIEEDTLLFQGLGMGTCLEWLNRKYKGNHKNQIKMALSRALFKLSLDPVSRKPSSLETELS